MCWSANSEADLGHTANTEPQSIFPAKGFCQVFVLLLSRVGGWAIAEHDEGGGRIAVIEEWGCMPEETIQ